MKIDIIDQLNKINKACDQINKINSDCDQYIAVKETIDDALIGAKNTMIEIRKEETESKILK